MKVNKDINRLIVGNIVEILFAGAFIIFSIPLHAKLQSIAMMEKSTHQIQIKLVEYENNNKIQKISYSN